MNNTAIRSKKACFFVLFLMFIALANTKAYAAKPSEVTLTINLREALILRSLLGQAQVEAEDIDNFLAIQEPLDKAIDSQPAKATQGQVVNIKLPQSAPQNIFVFLVNTIIRSRGAEETYALLEKIRKLLPQDSRVHELFNEGKKEINIAITPQEAELLYTLLTDIELQISELPILIALQSPLKNTLKQAKGNKKTTIKYAKATLHYLSVFSPRFIIQGSQVKQTKALLGRLGKLAQ